VPSHHNRIQSSGQVGALQKASAGERCRQWLCSILTPALLQRTCANLNLLGIPGRTNLVQPEVKIDDNWWEVFAALTEHTTERTFRMIALQESLEKVIGFPGLDDRFTPQ
jgi:hypothetical protein